MAGEAGTRPLLPQTAQLGYTFIPQTQQPREQQRNYVFVDEHNRHKRLKVMRACDGCRKRKIKCDAATTNTWPCGACMRHKLTCIPPTVSYEKDSDDGNAFEVNPAQQYRTVDHVQMYPPRMPSAPTATVPLQSGEQQATDTFATGMSAFQSQSYLEALPQDNELAYVTAGVSVGADNYGFPPTQSFDASYQHPAGDLAWNGNSSDIGADSLAEQMGDLNIDHTGVAPYILSQKKNASSHAIEDYEADLPIPQHTSSDYTIRIPPEMFPLEQTALQYFKYFFDNIHPYCPVISREHFLNQWHMDRESISTLLLEAIFAVSAMALEGTMAGTKWLALAGRHEDSFRDTPRLSTVQAMLILLKAREAVPKRGYFYRSWMTVVNSVLMCQELETNEHLDLHADGGTCGLPAHECNEKQRVWENEKQRVWHTLFVLEIMVGGPQARHDFRIEADTCDFSTPSSIPDFDEREVEISRQWAYWMRVARNVKETNLLWYNLSRQKDDWGIDPAFTGHNKDFEEWTRNLPRSLQIVLPSDGAEPWIPSHFIAQLHCWHHLSVIMHHRPQIRFMADAGLPGWKAHMVLCNESARSMCRIQEAILGRYGIKALSCMQRGISFTVYAVLTCTMVHLAAITAPDSELYKDAPDYFVRHMRLLEQCIQKWDMPDMHKQIDALREAFSADTSKPFELKQTFPYGSPPAQRSSQSPNLPTTSSFGGVMPETTGALQPTADAAPGQANSSSSTYFQAMPLPLTPPISIADTEPKADTPLGQSLVGLSSGATMLPGQQGLGAPTSAGVAAEQQAWNPTRIFDSFSAVFNQAQPQLPPTQPSASVNNAGHVFGTRGTSAGSDMSSLYSPPQAHQAGAVQYPSHSPSQQQTSVASSAGMAPAIAAHHVQYQQQHMPQPQQQIPAAALPNYMDPTQWQELVSRSFGDGGLKRRWDHAYGGVDLGGGMAKRSR